MIIPALDLIDGAVVRLFQGDYDKKTSYSFDPLNLLQEYEKEGASYLHLVDLTGAKKPNCRQLALIEKLVKGLHVPIQVGGGIRTEQDIKALLSLGVSRVVIGSKAILDQKEVAKWFQIFGCQKIVLALDVNIDDQGKAFVAYNGWKQSSSMMIDEIIEYYAPYGLVNVLCTDISKDGTLSGSNVEFYRALKKHYPFLDIQASGGIGTLQDVKEVNQTNIYGLIIGKALLDKKFSLKEALACWPNG